VGMKPKCPNCDSKQYLKRIVYGLPSSDFNFEKFHSGGCMPCEAKFHCSKCGWEDGPGIDSDSEDLFMS